MVKQIDKYLDKLFTDPIEINRPAGSVTIYPQNANNILEHFFRELNRRNCGKTRNNSIQQMLKSMLVDTPLVKNLDNPDYMGILLNAKADLDELFAHMCPISLAIEIESRFGKDRVLPGFRKTKRLPALPEHLMRLGANGNDLQMVGAT